MRVNSSVVTDKVSEQLCEQNLVNGRQKVHDRLKFVVLNTGATEYQLAHVLEHQETQLNDISLARTRTIYTHTQSHICIQAHADEQLKHFNKMFYNAK